MSYLEKLFPTLPQVAPAESRYLMSSTSRMSDSTN
uniref:Uncharacterized protein n=1 Tax=Anguilla anguilla TaxID=7936 RepID=A0A0E9PRQ6_ANGAN